jgi:nitrate/TMAO reductase-like tetraheme cytochrome c subunit
MKWPSVRRGASEPPDSSDSVESPEPDEVIESAELDESADDLDDSGDVKTVRKIKKARKKHFRRTRRAFGPLGRVLAKIPHPPWRSKRGILVLALLVGGFGAVAGVGGITAVHFSETPAFCGMCHTMDPELKAYAMSPHRDVACAECHVNPGLMGFVKAKMNGTKQLYGIITSKYPTPIEPPDHADMPPVKGSCMKCHALDEITKNGGPVKMVLRPRYRLDKPNTKETVAVMVRPVGLGEASASSGASDDGTEGVRGVHWHVQQDVTYSSGDIHAQKIDLVTITAKNGAAQQYIAGSEVAVSEDVKVDIDRLKLSETNRKMDCIDCHNRIGHGVPSPDRAIDEAMNAGKISPALPFIKRDSLALLNADYPTQAAADKAIEGLRARYPLTAPTQEGQVTKAIEELKVQYRLIATPAMKVQAKTYPDNLGHQTSPGCFRCHDGAHYLVVNNKITNKTIPSTCATCHTFPQVGANASSFPLGAKPVDHKDKLYVFSHKLGVKTADPSGTSCAACHAKSYCENCHKSGAIKVKHDTMRYTHPTAIKAAGGTRACQYCHLPAYCQKCHKDKNVLDPSSLPPAIIKVPTS